MGDLVERSAEAIWSRVPAGYGMTKAEAETYAKAVIAIALEEAAKVAEKGDWYGTFQTRGDERRAQSIASRIRDILPAEEEKR